MPNFRPMKPREPGSVFDAIASAVDQVGGPERFAAAVDRKPYWAYAVSDSEQSEKQRVNLSYSDACRLAGSGGTALAEHIALKAGGVFVSAGEIDSAALQAQLAVFSAESGEMMSDIIKRIADDEFCSRDGAAALPLIEDALRPLIALWHLCKTKADAK